MVCGSAFAFDLAGDIEPVLVEPGGFAYDLARLEIEGILQEIAQIGVRRAKVSPIAAKGSRATEGRIAGLDRRDFKRRCGVCRYLLRSDNGLRCRDSAGYGKKNVDDPKAAIRIEITSIAPAIIP